MAARNSGDHERGDNVTTGLNKLCLTLAACAALILTAAAANADDWMFFRGPYFDGTSKESDWNPVFSEENPPVAWRRDVGIGASSVIVVGDRVFTMGSRKSENEDAVSCLNAADGSVVWEFSYPNPFEARMYEGGTAATPTADGGRIYTLSHNGHIHCLNAADGEVVWKRNASDFAGATPRWKYAGSPLIAGDLVILDIGGDGNSTLALNKMTGEKVWGAGSDTPGYAPVIPFKQDGQDALLAFKAKALVAHALADGRELWRIGWESKYDVNASSPFTIGDKLFISSGYPTGRGALFRLGKGKPAKLWQNNDIKTKMNSCAPYKGHIYGISEKRGVLMCINMADGKTAWSTRGAGQYGTLTIAGDKLVVLTDSGGLVTCNASPDGYERISRAQILKNRAWVNPVLANGRIYCRDNVGNLACVDVRNK